MLPCAICGAPRRWMSWRCYQAHEDVCCPCARLNLRGSDDTRAHRLPQAPLTAPQEAALAVFQAHLAQVEDDDAG